jgi:hypothetical protein
MTGNPLLPDIAVYIGFNIPVMADEDDAAYTLTDVTSYVWTEKQPITITRGRQSALDRFEAGQCSLTLRDPDRRFDPSNIGGLYAPYVRPGARLRVSARWPQTSGTWVEVYNGYIDTWEPEPSGSPYTGAVKVRASDAFAVLNRVKFSGSGSAGQTTRSAVDAILDSAGWADTLAKRQLDLGADTALVARTYTNANALTSMQDLALAEGGSMFVDGRGRYTFRSRDWRAEHRDIVATFGNTLDTTSTWILGTSLLGVTTVPRSSSWVSGTPDETPYTKLRGKIDDRQLINDARVTRSGGSEQTATDATSVSDYGTRSYTESSIVQTDALALQRAQYLVSRYGTPIYRVDELTTAFQMAPTDAMKEALYESVDIDAFVIVIDRKGAGTVGTVVSECRVEGVTHTITWERWESTYRLSADSAVWVLDDTAFSILGTTTVLGW